MTINTSKEITDIVNHKEIEYCKNYLENKSFDSHFEIDNKEAFKLISNRDIQNIEIIKGEKKLNFLDQNPIEWFHSLMIMLWGSSS